MIGDTTNSNLTKCERKRLSIGIGLLINPSIVILEEPTIDLDYGEDKYILSLL